MSLTVEKTRNLCPQQLRPSQLKLVSKSILRFRTVHGARTDLSNRLRVSETQSHEAIIHT